VVNEPEGALIFAVIGLAVYEWVGSSCSAIRRDAYRFLRSDNFGIWCDLIGLDSDFALDSLAKMGYPATAEAPHHTHHSGYISRNACIN
jgi:hypothetical protein